MRKLDPYALHTFHHLGQRGRPVGFTARELDTGFDDLHRDCTGIRGVEKRELAGHRKIAADPERIIVADAGRTSCGNFARGTQAGCDTGRQ